MDHAEGVFLALALRGDAEKSFPVDEHPAVDGAGGTEERRPGGQAATEPRGRLLVGVEDGNVTAGLPGEDRLFDPPVGLEGPVIVDMIEGSVEQDRDVGMEVARPLELERAHLDDRPVRILGGVHVADQRGADVAADEDLFPRCGENLPDERRHGRFPVRAGDGDQRCLEKPEGQFEFTDDRDLPPERLLEDEVRLVTPGDGTTSSAPAKTSAP